MDHNSLQGTTTSPHATISQCIESQGVHGADLKYGLASALGVKSRDEIAEPKVSWHILTESKTDESMALQDCLWRPSDIGTIRESPSSDWGFFTTVSKGPEFMIRADSQWQSAGVPWTTGLLIPRIQPELIINPSARPLLTDRAQEVLNRLLELMERVAHRNFMPVSKIEVSGFVDREEDIEELVVTQWVKVSPRSALRYWDRLSAIVGIWTASLPDELARIAAERLAVEVRWEHNATTIQPA